MYYIYWHVYALSLLIECELTKWLNPTKKFLGHLHTYLWIYIYIFLSISCIFFQELFYSLISYNNILCEYFSNIFSLYFLYLFYILSCTFIFSIVDLILRFEIILRKYYHIIEKRYMSEHSIPIFFHLHFSRAIIFIGIKSMTSIVLERTFTIDYRNAY